MDIRLDYLLVVFVSVTVGSDSLLLAHVVAIVDESSQSQKQNLCESS